MKIGIIGAMQMEIDELKESMTEPKTEQVSGVTYYSGTVAGVDVVAAVCGVGKVFAAICAEAMILHFGVDRIINIGVAGTLTRDLGVLDVAVANKVVQHDMNTSAIGDPIGLISGINEIFLPADEAMRKLLCACLKEEEIRYLSGPIATGDLFVETNAQRAVIRDRFGAIAAEMEGGSIGHVCYVNQIPFAILRSISDADGGAMDFETFAEKAAVQSIRIVIRFLERIGELSDFA